MIRPKQVRLKLSKSQFQYCQLLSEESAKVWNFAKNFFWRTDPSQTQDKKGIWLSEGALKRYTKQRFALHSLSRRRALLLADSVQAVIEKFYTNLKASRILRTENPQIRYPYKNKNWFCVHWKKKAIKIKGRLLTLSNGKGHQGIVFTLPTYLADCHPRTVELIWRNGYWLSVTLELPNKEHSKQLSFNTAAVDMQETTHAFGLAGEIHAMTIRKPSEAPGVGWFLHRW